MTTLRRPPWRIVVGFAAVIAVGGSVALLTRSESTGWHPGFGSNRVELSVAGGCPQPHLFDTVANPQGGSPVRLVPLGPSTVLICRYGPKAATPGASDLYRQFRGDTTEAGRIAVAADEIRSSAPPSGPISCPAAVESATLLAFAYPDGAQAALEWHDSGCEELDNGNLAAFQMNDGFSAFQRAVDAVAPPQQLEG